jgi:hypothetical protein
MKKNKIARDLRQDPQYRQQIQKVKRNEQADKEAEEEIEEFRGTCSNRLGGSLLDE